MTKNTLSDDYNEVENAIISDDTKGVYSRQIALLLIKMGSIDNVVTESRERLKQHDSRIAMLEECSKTTSQDINAMKITIDTMKDTIVKFINAHSGDSTKIIMWVGGILTAQALAIVGAVFGIVKMFGDK